MTGPDTTSHVWTGYHVTRIRCGHKKMAADDKVRYVFFQTPTGRSGICPWSVVDCQPSVLFVLWQRDALWWRHLMAHSPLNNRKIINGNGHKVAFSFCAFSLNSLKNFETFGWKPDYWHNALPCTFTTEPNLDPPPKPDHNLMLTLKPSLNPQMFI